MRRVRYHEHGGPQVLRLEEAADPEPGPGELLIRTEAIGVTLPGVRAVRGNGELPGVLGGDVAGTVVAIGAGVTEFRPGEKITGISFTGSYSDLAVVPTFVASRIPQGADAVQAVALVRGGHVALAAFATAGIHSAADAPESILITAAASSIGHLAVQLAKIYGIRRVVAAVSSPAKAEFVMSQGADEVVIYREEPWCEPVECVLEGVGGEVLPHAVAALAPGGRMVFFGSGGGSIPAYDLLAGAKQVVGMNMAAFSSSRRDLYERHGEDLWDLVAAGRLNPAVHAVIPLAEAARAHEVIEARANLGKVVLRP